MKKKTNIESKNNGLSYADLAERWGISVMTSRRMVKKHGMKVRRFSATLVRIPLSEVERIEAEAME
jgi:excisionase family DNA binding protein